LASLQVQAKDLLALAHDPSEQARAALASGLYDLSHVSADLPVEGRALAADIILEIIKSAATSVRHQVAQRLARDPRAPKALVLALARDEISVAFPVLIESPVLDEADILDVLRTSPPEHRLGMLQRELLSETVATAVVDTRDPQIMRWLVENPGAKIPAAAMAVLVEASRAETGLQQPLINRADLTSELAAKLHAFVPDELRQQLVSRHKFAIGAPGQSSAGPALDATASAAADARALAVAQELRGAGALNIDLLVKTIRAGKMTEFEALFARFSSISLAAARQILSSSAGDALAVALKAQGVAKGTFATIFILTRKARDPGADLSTALARATDAYDRLPVIDAKKRFAALQAAHPPDPAP
jgi:uncharacterized protein (DUF2336 family)